MPSAVLACACSRAATCRPVIIMSIAMARWRRRGRRIIRPASAISHSELRVLGRDDHVGCQGKFEPPGQRRSVDGSNDRLFEGPVLGEPGEAAAALVSVELIPSAAALRSQPAEKNRSPPPAITPTDRPSSSLRSRNASPNSFDVAAFTALAFGRPSVISWTRLRRSVLTGALTWVLRPFAARRREPPDRHSCHGQPRWMERSKESYMSGLRQIRAGMTKAVFASSRMEKLYRPSASRSTE